MIIPPLFCCHSNCIDFSQENADHQSSSTNTIHVTTADDKSEPSPSYFTPQSQSADDILVPFTPHSLADLAQIKIHIPQGILNFSCDQ